MSRNLLINAGSLDSLKVRTRCGTSPCAFEMPCTALRLIPIAFAMARPVQCVVSPGGTWRVSSTTRSTVALGSGGVRGGRVLSRTQQPIQALGHEPGPPAPDARLGDTGSAHDRVRAQSL